MWHGIYVRRNILYLWQGILVTFQYFFFGSVLFFGECLAQWHCNLHVTVFFFQWHCCICVLRRFICEQSDLVVLRSAVNVIQDVLDL